MTQSRAKDPWAAHGPSAEPEPFAQESPGRQLEPPDARDEFDVKWPLSVRLIFILAASLALSAVTILMALLLID
ncbi:MAG TPA: hypothetical protein VFE11_01235 [Dongiaceae bacterium]|nr:hypothetical protein [Dongiaceae bacterium]